MSRTQAQVEQSLVNRINTLNPSVDASGSDVADVFVIPEATEIRGLEQRQDSIGFRFSTAYTSTQDRNVQILYGANHGLRPDRGSPSVCRGVAYRYSRPVNENVRIPAGTLVSTTDETVSFRVQFDAVMYLDRVDSYYNASKRRYEVPVTLVSIGTGDDYVVPPKTLRKLRDSIAGIDGIENTTRSTTSTAEENLTQFGQRVQRIFNGLDLASADGIYTVLRRQDPTLIQDVIPIFSADLEFFQRRTRRASWDVYIRGMREETTEDTISATGATSYVLSKQPALSVSSVRINGIVTPFTFVEDDRPEYKASSRAEDYIAFAFAPASGSEITVSYTWNSVITQLQDFVDSRRNQLYRNDMMVREAQPVLTRIRIQVQATSTSEPATVVSNVRDGVYAWFQDPARRSELSPDALRTSLKQTVSGIQDLTITVFCRADVAALDVESIPLAPYEYGDTNDTILTVVST